MCIPGYSLFYRRLASGLTALCFLAGVLLPSAALALPAVAVQPGADQVTALPAVAGLPAVGSRLALTPAYAPALIRGLQIIPDQPLAINFIIDSGQDNLQGEALREETDKLIKYFLASLTIPQDRMWVNLSPYESDRVIPEAFGATRMGRDLLAQDYLLKQLAASLMYPEEEAGAAFWRQARARAGDAGSALKVFNKVWIVPERASVLVDNNTVVVEDCYLKVMMEEDYLAARAGQEGADADSGPLASRPSDQAETDPAAAAFRALLLPRIEREVNQGRTFANLRQIFHSMILAHWYKQNLRAGLLGEQYADQSRTGGLTDPDPAITQNIYRQYLAAFEQGVFNFIREDQDPVTGQAVPRKYFSGGVDPSRLDVVSQSSPVGSGRRIIEVFKKLIAGTLLTALVTLAPPGGAAAQDTAPAPPAGVTDQRAPAFEAQSIRRQVLEYVQFVSHRRFPLPTRTDSAFWRQYLGKVAAQKGYGHAAELRAIIQDSSRLEAFILYYFRAVGIAHRLTRESNLNSRRNLEEILATLDDVQNFTDRSLEEVRLRDFFEFFWSEFIKAVMIADSSLIHEKGQLLLGRASDLSMELLAMMREVTAVLPYLGDREKVREVLRSWGDFNERFMIPNGYYGMLLSSEARDDKTGRDRPALYSIVSHIERTETQEDAAGDEVPVLYVRRIDHTQVLSPGAAHFNRQTGRAVVYLDQMEMLAGNITGSRQGLRYLFGREGGEVFDVESVDRWIGQRYRGFTDDQIVRRIAHALLVHEMAHRDAEQFGFRSNDAQTFGIPAAEWQRLSPAMRRNIRQEVAAYAVQMASTDIPGYVFVQLLTDFRLAEGTPAYFAARYLFNTLAVKTGLRAETAPWVDGRDLEQLKALVSQLLDVPEDQLQQAVRRHILLPLTGNEQGWAGQKSGRSSNAVPPPAVSPQQVHQLALAHVQYCRDNHKGLPDAPDHDTWRQYLQGLPNYPNDVAMLSGDDTLLDVFMIYVYRAVLAAQEKTKDVNPVSADNLARAIELFDDTAFFNDRSLLDIQLRNFFEYEWSVFIEIVATGNAEGIRESGREMIARAGLLSPQLKEMMEQVSAGALDLSNDKEMRSLVDRWQLFNQRVLIPLGYYGTLDRWTETNHLTGTVERKLKSFISRIEKRGVGADSRGVPVPIVYGRRIDRAGFDSDVGHSYEAEDVIYIDLNWQDIQVAAIRATLDGEGYIFTREDSDDYFGAPALDQWVRRRYKGMSDAQIRAGIDRDTRVHELAHKDLERRGGKTRKGETFGLSPEDFAALPAQNRELIAPEIFAYATQMIMSDNPDYVVLQFLPQLFWFYGTPTYFAGWHIARTLGIPEGWQDAANPWRDRYDGQAIVELVFRLVELGDGKTKAALKELLTDLGLPIVEPIPYVEDDSPVEVTAPSSSAVPARQAPEDVGGIDLNPAAMRMDVSGPAVPLPLPANRKMEGMDLEGGLVPVIINIAPITDIPLFLGKSLPTDRPAAPLAALP